MDLKLSEAQEMLQREARRFFSQQVSKERIGAILATETGFDGDLWQRMAELGWLGVLIPEEYGGAGGSFLDLAVLLQEMGRALLPSPYFATAAVGTTLALELGSDAQKKRYLAAIAGGETVCSAAIVEAEGTYCAGAIETTAARAGAAFVLSGQKLFVPYGLAANTLVCVAKIAGGPPREHGVFIVDAASTGVTRRPMRTITREFYAEVTLDGVAVGPEGALAADAGAWDALERSLLKAAVARCAMAVGAAEHVLDIAVAYAKERVQFDRPIGSFQAIQHQCADMLTELDTARLLTYEAAWRISSGLPYQLEAAMAKAWCGKAYKAVTRLGHQVMGGVGLIDEHEMHLFYRDAAAMDAMFGDSQEQYDVVAKLLA